MHKNSFLWLVYLAAAVLLGLGLGLLAGWFDSGLAGALVQLSGRRVSPLWVGYFRAAGGMALGLGTLLLGWKQVSASLLRLWAWFQARVQDSDAWVERRWGVLHPAQERSLLLPVLNRWDALAALFFGLVALLYQLAVMSSGYPTVVLGGDAANIASFAAGRALPDLFAGDAILGNLQNIGLYVTVHLPLTIGLEKLVGNFGLAYALLLFPHVFLQYFGYYWLGRALYQSRFWAFLFTLAVSSPLSLDGGEMWGVMSDAMPRFTFQVVLPFLLTALLTVWRERPERWHWVMVLAGLMAFVHPVSTPTWAFALWLGFWVMLPGRFSLRQKIWQMFKLGLTLTAALLPYVAIYLSYHQSGQDNRNYDLVYFVLSEYFPYNLLNIPAAVQTLLQNSAQTGLLWLGLAGLALSAWLFKAERGRLKILLTWVAGIVFVTILVPWVETTVERTLRMIPLQTELMRGMRYLVPFLFVFWFYPLAELTRRLPAGKFSRWVMALGLTLTAGWLWLNPPAPYWGAVSTLECWSTGQWICPTNTDYANTLRYVREETPQGAKFVVFLSYRWSGIEVRYLGLRPMAYAFKDKGQLTFTNLEALEEWHYFLQRENIIYSRQLNPLVEQKRPLIVDFARDAHATYILTDFPFPPEVQEALGVQVVYESGAYSILLARRP